MNLTVDNKQRIKTALLFILEFYKILMGTFLIAFVPQSCGKEVCSVSQNIKDGDTLHLIANGFNLFTFLFVLNFYKTEMQRENWCITYLDIDETKPNDYLDEQIERYPKIKQKMLKLNKAYLRDTYLALGFLICNFVLSGVSIGYNYVGTNTVTSIVSFLLLVTIKITSALNVGKESVLDDHALSSYMKTYKTYNVIDKDFIKKDNYMNNSENNNINNETNNINNETNNANNNEFTDMLAIVKTK